MSDEPKRKPGRPRKLPVEGRITVKCVLFEKEKAKFDAARAVVGMTQLEFSRAAILHAADQIVDGKPPPFAQPAPPEPPADSCG